MIWLNNPVIRTCFSTALANKQVAAHEIGKSSTGSGKPIYCLPSRVAEGLAANDRVKLRLSVLQAAVQRACEPTSARFDLTDECRAAGVDPVALEALVNHATLSVGDRISAPGLGSLATAIWDDAEAMIHAVGAGDQDQADKAEKRLSTIRALNSDWFFRRCRASANYSTDRARR